MITSIEFLQDSFFWKQGKCLYFLCPAAAILQVRGALRNETATSRSSHSRPPPRGHFPSLPLAGPFFPPLSNRLLIRHSFRRPCYTGFLKPVPAPAHVSSRWIKIYFCSTVHSVLWSPFSLKTTRKSHVLPSHIFCEQWHFGSLLLWSGFPCLKLSKCQGLGSEAPIF